MSENPTSSETDHESINNSDAPPKLTPEEICPSSMQQQEQEGEKDTEKESNKETGVRVQPKVSVQDIFTLASNSFNEISNLYSLLNDQENSKYGNIWTVDHANRLKDSIATFTKDISLISKDIQERAHKRIKVDLKKSDVIKTEVIHRPTISYQTFPQRPRQFVTQARPQIANKVPIQRPMPVPSRTGPMNRPRQINVTQTDISNTCLIPNRPNMATKRPFQSLSSKSSFTSTVPFSSLAKSVPVHNSTNNEIRMVPTSRVRLIQKRMFTNQQ
ncbi:Hypothetical protein SRAE_1000164300 [Strongyloides ratti]|uniref:Uncharacterized protein n=1 Tax=Strongyloides ratti TaxID=34506 RepID=A0A090L119_STRRB|nr:Hypothetical protein SRAE_1000164300 [Strongyloides ratti]CEF63381.1 Hypothetical protein SRAE_1000164300 [Strongyloides ratti]